ncbi:hypothetical protein N9B53_01455 [Mariniblastus sp.]|nr:hypothetical protein [Mariniblastus sp.]
MNKYFLTRVMAVCSLIAGVAALAAPTYRVRKPAKIMEKIAVQGTMTDRQTQFLSEEKTSPEYRWNRMLRLKEVSITDAQAKSLAKIEPVSIRGEGWSPIKKYKKPSSISLFRKSTLLMLSPVLNF